MKHLSNNMTARPLAGFLAGLVGIACLLTSAPTVEANTGLRMCRVVVKANYKAEKLQCMDLSKKGQNGTTLAAYKTLDICSNPDGSWTYSGVISVWNEGAVDTAGCLINDRIESKTSGPVWTTAYTPLVNSNCNPIPAGTTEATALTFPYSVTGAPLAGSIRNVAKVTITNHSGQLGKNFGPEPKATWDGEVDPCDAECGCTYTQGYWDNKPGVVWPAPYDRNDQFYGSGLTWQQIMGEPVGGNAYINLAHQYIAAVLNQANGACVPEGVADTIDLAETWFADALPSECGGSKCGTQTTWAGALDDYNNGEYPGGPAHCE
jgi:hypothetical protein